MVLADRIDKLAIVDSPGGFSERFLLVEQFGQVIGYPESRAAVFAGDSDETGEIDFTSGCFCTPSACQYLNCSSTCAILSCAPVRGVDILLHGYRSFLPVFQGIEVGKHSGEKAD